MYQQNIRNIDYFFSSTRKNNASLPVPYICFWFQSLWESNGKTITWKVYYNSVESHGETAVTHSGCLL